MEKNLMENDPILEDIKKKCMKKFKEDMEKNFRELQERNRKITSITRMNFVKL